MSELDVAAWTRQQVEARLELARHAGDGRWETGCTCTGACHGFPPCDEVTGDDIHIYPEGAHDADQAAHIAANDPRSVIARCEAELAILDEHGIVWRDIGWLEEDKGELCEESAEIPVCGACVPKHSHFRRRTDVPVGACRTVRLLATGYRHQPGYQEA